jgi:hypothetical protein
MSRWVVLWLAMAVMVGGWAGWISAQVIDGPTKVDPPILVQGSNLGFRIFARQGGKAIGRLVVRIDGKWVETDATITPIR